MPVNEFEKQVQQKMDELKLAPSPEVWSEVEKQIRKDKKRRRIIFWWMIPLLLVGGGAIYMVTGSGDKTSVAQKENSSPSAATNTISNEVATTPGNETPDPSTQTATNNNQPAAKNFQLNNSTPTGTTAQSTIEVINPGKTRKKTKPAVAESEISVLPTENIITQTDKGINEKKEVTSDTVADTVSSIAGNNPVAEQSRPAEKNDTAVAVMPEEKKPDQTPVAETVTPAKQKTKKDWTLGFAFQAGSSNTRWGQLFSSAQANFDASPLTSAPGSGSSSNPPVYLHAPDNGFSMGFEVFAQKELSKRLAVRAAVNYNHLSTHIRIGNRVDSTRYVFNNMSNGVVVDNYYRNSTGGATDRNYTNNYHLAGLSATLSWKLIDKKTFSLSWENGIGVSRLLSTNALHYDRILKAYYKDFEPFRKTQVFISSGLSVPLVQKTKFTLALNPTISYGTSTVLKQSDGPAAHFINYGVGLRFSFSQKN